MPRSPGLSAPRMKSADEHGDVGTTSQLEVYIDETERRTWFLNEASRIEPRSASAAQFALYKVQSHIK